jgi:hypothetical protein
MKEPEAVGSLSAVDGYWPDTKIANISMCCAARRAGLRQHNNTC